jgi:L-ascorbate metabolism protein UlaG (beta-lactamase superfamily)
LPAYNLDPTRLQFHPRERNDNSYLVTVGGLRLYISGDTEDIPEMRSLQNIDAAFICMNLPYTMTVEQAADAVLDFAPHIVYPYHYRGKNGMSDLDRFTALVSANPSIEVRRLAWY